jgi:hypothetical protein
MSDLRTGASDRERTVAALREQMAPARRRSRVLVSVFSSTVRAGANGPDAPRPGVPSVRVVAVGLFGGLDLWRVPTAWRDRSFREVIKGIRSGRHRELSA